jgi:hypothetical protein
MKLSQWLKRPPSVQQGDDAASASNQAVSASNQESSPSDKWRFEMMKDYLHGHTSKEAAGWFESAGYTAADFYDYFPCFLGAGSIGRYLSLYECYKQTLGVAGHIAEVGVYRGAVSLLFTKLVLLYEPYSTTQVHGFDMYERAVPSTRGKGFSFVETYQRVKNLIDIQGLQANCLLHDVNAIDELPGFFEQAPHLQFKLVFLDAGDYDIVSSCLREFWPRLTTGGIIIFDQFNHEAAPGETRAVKEFLPPGTAIRTFPNGWMPNAYVVKT